MPADGSAETRLVVGTADFWPYGGVTWSPDGLTIGFHAGVDWFGDSLTQIYLINADGSGVRRLTTSCSYASCGMQSAEGNPSWSPDGTSIVFWSFFSRITVIPSNGTTVSSLTGQSNVWFDSSPDWSPDGKWVVYQKEGQLWIVLVGAPSSATQITTVSGGAADPSWSRAVP
jgi:TolB protein